MEKSKIQLQAAFLFLLISGTLGFEEESCNSLLGLLNKYQNFSKLQDNLSETQNRLSEVNLKYSELLEKHLESHDKCTDIALKYAEIQEKFQQTNQKLRKSQESLQETTLKYEKVQDELKKINIEELRMKDLYIINLEMEILEKNNQIKLLNDTISDPEKSSELKELEKWKKLTQNSQEVIIGSANNDSKVNSATKVMEKFEDQLLSILTGVEILNSTNSKTPIEILPDGCPSKQNYVFTFTKIQIPGLEPFEVCCHSTWSYGAGWMDVYSYRYTTSMTFNRTYEEYINGFGDSRDDTNFMGLEKLHILTNWKPHEVYIEIFSFTLHCKTFVVGDKSEGYNVKKIDECNKYTELFNIIEGNKFSAYDRDEDGNPNHHWAKELGYGWWFSSEKKRRISWFKMRIRRTDWNKQPLSKIDFEK